MRFFTEHYSRCVILCDCNISYLFQFPAGWNFVLNQAGMEIGCVTFHFEICRQYRIAGFVYEIDDHVFHRLAYNNFCCIIFSNCDFSRLYDLIVFRYFFQPACFDVIIVFFYCDTFCSNVLSIFCHIIYSDIFGMRFFTEHYSRCVILCDCNISYLFQFPAGWNFVLNQAGMEIGCVTFYLNICRQYRIAGFVHKIKNNRLMTWFNLKLIFSIYQRYLIIGIDFRFIRKRNIISSRFFSRFSR